MKLSDLGLIAKNGEIFRPKARTALQDHELYSILKTKGVLSKDFDTVTEELVKEAVEKLSGMSFSDVQQARQDVFKDCIYSRQLKTIKFNGNTVAYMTHPSGWRTLGLAEELTPQILSKVFTVSYPEEIVALTASINNIDTGKNGALLKHVDVAEHFIEDMMPSADKYVDTEITQSPSPLLLEGDKRPALKYLPFKLEDGTVNSTMKEFLGRMNQSEYFCAYLWSALLGHEIQQLLYLYGEGGDGKSSLLKVLANMTGSLAAFSENSKHSYHSMHDKAIINLSESSEKHILLKPNIKIITGRDAVQIEAKFKDAYTDRIKGLFIIDSNNKPYVLGNVSETRRLRLFEIAPPPKSTVVLGAIEYVEKMQENFNGFMNHCRQCYEQLKNPDTGLVSDPPNLNEQLMGLTDKHAQMLYEKLLTRMAGKDYKLGKTLEMSELELRGLMYTLTETAGNDFKTRFFADNFIKYLQIKYEVKLEDNKYNGIGLEEGYRLKTGRK